jgi:hypothetical protein
MHLSPTTAQSLTNIVNLKQYDLVLTTSWEFKFGVCGHLFEMIDYYYAIKTYTPFTPCILLADGTTKQELLSAIESKYDNLTVENIVVHYRPKVVIANNILITDGSHRLRGADLLAKNIFLFRCSENDFTYFTKFKSNIFLLQDFEIYNDRPIGVNIVDYKKKILFSKYKNYNNNVKNVAMYYLTSLCRKLSDAELETTLTKHQFNDSIILTDDVSLYPNRNTFKIPVDDIWDKFSTYIYTSVPRKIDCSSRFIVECLYYGKNIIYDIDYYDRALEVRKKDTVLTVSLTKDDEFLKLLHEQNKC